VHPNRADGEPASSRKGCTVVTFRVTKASVARQNRASQWFDETLDIKIVGFLCADLVPNRQLGGSRKQRTQESVATPLCGVSALNAARDPKIGQLSCNECEATAKLSNQEIRKHHSLKAG
jgi:hypothetical protein